MTGGGTGKRHDYGKNKVDVNKKNKSEKRQPAGGERGINQAGVDWREARRWVPAVPVVTARTRV